MNDDADLPLVISMVLTVNTAENDSDKATVTVDLGNIGPEEMTQPPKTGPSKM